ncbi:MAG TPA: glycoside hydrolase family 2 TIM barrel-domain containing protein [Bacteroidales bacterium]|nr:glycoside hydrolase family 2 TIM barrel-domain containing protein [Bacteroidales bacterium]HQH24093.1 glycoside hydrolase family 2 TIM barrel-domain containing protein [Bacteroidales bacterium]HQJ83047.1 glycoside hydrolase family 2 TIM barrel-domain containing protein [Bacteroidales bacterium]
MKKITGLLTAILLIAAANGQKAEIVYLSGTDNENTVLWDFFCTGGQNSGKWTKIPVPSNWELQGFGTYNYGNDKQQADEKGLYRHEFTVPAAAGKRRIFLVFEGSMTDTEVRVNGKPAGTVHQGAFYRFSYEITSLIKPRGSNLLEVTVSKKSADESINRAEREADYWIFGGIHRPVYLKIVPYEFIEHVAVNAEADGDFTAELTLKGCSGTRSIEAMIMTPDGRAVAGPFTTGVKKGQTRVLIRGKADKPKQWTPESPDLYRAVFRLKDKDAILYETEERIGFRTVEVRQNDGIYVNGVRVMFRGICRHNSWPSSGKTTSKKISILDVNLMKDMNVNAVRMTHYPPDKHFLEVCDSLGLFVINELSGWQAYYDTGPGRKLVRELVERDVNHPCIILWANGNERGFNPELREEFAKYDPQKRLVIEPISNFNGMDTKHYIPYNYGVSTFFNGRDIFFPTEWLHGCYDGGSGAGLDDYWNLMLSNPLSAGGFLWLFADEGVVRTDRKDSIDTAGNQAPDGIVGPYREKEGSWFTVRDVWSPLWLERKIITPEFDGRLKIENRFLYTSLDKCRLSYYLIKFSDSFPVSVTQSEKQQIDIPPLRPGQRDQVQLSLQAGWNDYDAIRIDAEDPSGRLINSWSFGHSILPARRRWLKEL